MLSSDELLKKEIEQALPKVINYCKTITHDYKDLVQETFLKAWQIKRRYKAGTNISAWLISIAKQLNKRINFNNSHSPEVSVDEFFNEVIQIPEPEQTPTELVEECHQEQQLTDKVRGAMVKCYQAMPPKLKPYLEYFSDGKTHEEIAEILNVSVQFIDKWKPIYFEQGTDGLKLKYKGSEGYLSKQEKQSVIEYIQSQETLTSYELKEHIKKTYGFEYNSPSSYTTLLHEANFSYKKTQKVNPKGNPEQIEVKKKEIQTLIDDNKEDIKNGNLIIWMQDECHQLWGDTCGYVWGKSGERLEIPMTNFRKRQTWYGAINCYTGQFILGDYESGRTKFTIEFVKSILKKFPLSRHVFIWDGASCHVSNEFKEYLKSVNDGLSEEAWKMKCIKFAPNAPQQNPVAMP